MTETNSWINAVAYSSPKHRLVIIEVDPCVLKGPRDHRHPEYLEHRAVQLNEITGNCNGDFALGWYFVLRLLPGIYRDGFGGMIKVGRDLDVLFVPPDQVKQRNT